LITLTPGGKISHPRLHLLCPLQRSKILRVGDRIRNGGVDDGNVDGNDDVGGDDGAADADGLRERHRSGIFAPSFQCKKKQGSLTEGEFSVRLTSLYLPV
jgi:hypothetical protein